jgi:hypothetical protein
VLFAFPPGRPIGVSVFIESKEREDCIVTRFAVWAETLRFIPHAARCHGQAGYH